MILWPIHNRTLIQISFIIIQVFGKYKILSSETILSIYTHAHTRNTCTHTHAHMHSHTHTCTHTHTHRTHMHTNTHMHTHTHTHTHTGTKWAEQNLPPGSTFFSCVGWWGNIWKHNLFSHMHVQAPSEQNKIYHLEALFFFLCWFMGQHLKTQSFLLLLVLWYTERGTTPLIKTSSFFSFFFPPL